MYKCVRSKVGKVRADVSTSCAGTQSQDKIKNPGVKHAAYSKCNI